MKQVIILSGIPGSGKSHYAQRLIQENGCDGAIASVDSFFARSDGTWQFNPDMLEAAHSACFRHFITCLNWDPLFLIVDNTNISEIEIAPYYVAANAFGCEVNIHELVCPLEVALKRQTHNVPRSKVEQMWAKLLLRRLPPWWRTTKISDV